MRQRVLSKPFRFVEYTNTKPLPLEKSEFKDQGSGIKDQGSGSKDQSL